MTNDHPLIEVTQADRAAAKALTEYAGFRWSADHLDMAIEAATEAFARHRVLSAAPCDTMTNDPPPHRDTDLNFYVRLTDDGQYIRDWFSKMAYVLESFAPDTPDDVSGVK